MRAQLGLSSLIAFSFLGCHPEVPAQRLGAPDPVVAIRDDVLHHAQGPALVKSLVDECGPRLTGSAGYERAVAWGVRTMQQLGLKNVHTEPVTAPAWVRGEESGQLLAPYAFNLSLTALGGSVSTPPGGIEGEVIEVPSLEALAALPREQVEGKIVILNKVTERTRSGEGYGKAGDIRGAGPSAAAKQGAIGVLTRSLATGTERFPHTGMLKYDPAVAKLPAAALAVPDVELIHRLLASGQKVRVRYTLGAHMIGDVQTANVVGEVPGTELPNEVVILGAHLDSWDLAGGAIDDGAGVAMVLDAARAIAAHGGARRTVRVVLFNNEEMGLSGAKAYAQQHAAELANHVAALELDFGTGSSYGLGYVAGPGSKDVIEAAARPLLPLGVAAPEPAPYHGSDLYPMRAAGVPMLTLMQDGTTYFDHHHSANDTLERIEPNGLAQTAAAAATLAKGLADAPGRMAPIPEEQRKGH